MGRVYKGVHPTIGSRVAIKVLSRECSDRRDLVERFFAEAKAVNLIRHESIVNVLDLAMLPDGRPYIVMEYLDGAPLVVDHRARAVSAVRCRSAALARLVAEVLDALGAAHAKGIVHRDLKPDNIFVDADRAARRCSTSASRSSSPSSAAARPTPARCSARRTTCRPSKPRASRSTRAPISTRWWCVLVSIDAAATKKKKNNALLYRLARRQPLQDHRPVESGPCAPRR